MTTSHTRAKREPPAANHAASLRSMQCPAPPCAMSTPGARSMEAAAAAVPPLGRQAGDQLRCRPTDRAESCPSSTAPRSALLPPESLFPARWPHSWPQTGAAGSTPNGRASVAKVVAFYGKHGTAQAVSGVLVSLGALLFLVFAATFRSDSPCPGRAVGSLRALSRRSGRARRRADDPARAQHRDRRCGGLSRICRAWHLDTDRRPLAHDQNRGDLEARIDGMNRSPARASYAWCCAPHLRSGPRGLRGTSDTSTGTRSYGRPSLLSRSRTLWQLPDAAWSSSRSMGHLFREWESGRHASAAGSRNVRCYALACGTVRGAAAGAAAGPAGCRGRARSGWRRAVAPMIVTSGAKSPKPASSDVEAEPRAESAPPRAAAKPWTSCGPTSRG